MNPTSFKSSDVQTGATRVAGAVADLSEHAGEQINKVAQGAADTIRDASDGFRENASDVGAQIKRYLKANPTYALLGGVVLGFVVGRLMSRD